MALGPVLFSEAGCGSRQLCQSRRGHRDGVHVRLRTQGWLVWLCGLQVPERHREGELGRRPEAQSFPGESPSPQGEASHAALPRSHGGSLSLVITP